jgi:hypothetical protein
VAEPKRKEHPTVTTNLWQETRDAYLNEHPGPKVIDFGCPRCKAQPGELCRKPDGHHLDSLPHQSTGAECQSFQALAVQGE